MNKKSKNGIYVIIFIIFVSIFLIGIDIYFNEIREERFYERTEKLHENCLQEAKLANVEGRWCTEIRLASVNTYSLARSSNRVSLSMFTLVFAGMLIGLVSLKSQLEALKEKLNV